MALKPTTVPAVIDRLVDVVSAHEGMANALVLDGPLLSGNYKNLNVIIGWSENDRPAATTTRQAPAGIRSRDGEAWTISVLIGAVDGSTTDQATKNARDLAAAAFAVFEEIVTSDVTLGKVCGQITIGDQQWWQSPGSGGMEVAVIFQLTGKALL